LLTHIIIAGEGFAFVNASDRHLFYRARRKPTYLLVQLPVKFEMAVNLKTAKALGLTVPQSIFVRTGEVIE
jgi:hypothetical protein